MLGWFVRLSLALASWVTALFVARDAVNFGVVNVFVAIFLLALGVGIVAFWPMIRDAGRTAYQAFFRRP
jgi:fucose permease